MRFLNSLFPPVCVSCSSKSIEVDGYLCQECFLLLDFLDSSSCPKCAMPVLDGICYPCLQNPNMFVDKISSVCRYAGNGSNMVKQFKYYHNQRIGRFMAKLISRNAFDALSDVDFLCPVPVSGSKLIFRQFHHTHFLTYEIAKILKKPMISNLILKLSKGSAQAGLSRADRFLNIEGLFGFNFKHTKLVFDKKIAIIDDVITTTATVSECAKVLKTYGCASFVSGISFARTVV